MERESFSRAKVIGTITGFCSSAFSRVYDLQVKEQKKKEQEKKKNKKINK